MHDRKESWANTVRIKENATYFGLTEEYLSRIMRLRTQNAHLTAANPKSLVPSYELRGSEHYLFTEAQQQAAAFFTLDLIHDAAIKGGMGADKAIETITGKFVQPGEDRPQRSVLFTLPNDLEIDFKAIHKLLKSLKKDGLQAAQVPNARDLLYLQSMGGAARKLVAAMAKFHGLDDPIIPDQFAQLSNKETGAMVAGFLVDAKKWGPLAQAEGLGRDRSPAN